MVLISSINVKILTAKLAELKPLVMSLGVSPYAAFTPFYFVNLYRNLCGRDVLMEVHVSDGKTFYLEAEPFIEKDEVRALRILESPGGGAPGRELVRKLAAEMNLKVSSAYELLRRMETSGLIERIGKRGRYVSRPS